MSPTFWISVNILKIKKNANDLPSEQRIRIFCCVHRVSKTEQAALDGNIPEKFYGWSIFMQNYNFHNMNSVSKNKIKMRESINLLIKYFDFMAYRQTHRHIERLIDIQTD